MSAAVQNWLKPGQTPLDLFFQKAPAPRPGDPVLSTRENIVASSAPLVGLQPYNSEVVLSREGFDKFFTYGNKNPQHPVEMPREPCRQ